MQDFLDLLRQPWISTLTGIVGLAAGLLFYMRSVRSPRPSFQKSALRILRSSEGYLPPEVNVFFRNERIERLTRTTLVLWNHGTDVLYGDRIAENDPLKICFNRGDEILNCTIVKTKEANDLRVVKSSDEPHQLLVSFSYLDPGDGASIELLHTSEDRYPRICGSIMGLPRGFEDLGAIRTAEALAARGSASWALIRIRRFTNGAVLVMGLIMTGMGFVPLEIRENYSDPLPGWILIVGGLLYMALPAGQMFLKRRRHPRALRATESES